ncbi:MAG: porin family protein [Desulfobacula sp.]|jgi:opacity protein-like surface antigen|nr:porin family protein [Desulfobacula sp.]
MKKISLFLLNCVFILSFSAIAYSEQGPYVSGNIGAAWLSNIDLSGPGLTYELESNMGVSLGVALGYDLGNNIRIEGELAYQYNDLDKIALLGGNPDANGDASSSAFLLNFYYDFKNDTPFITSITTGIGLANAEIETFNATGIPIGSFDDTAFAFQVGGGVGYAINKKVIIDFRYRYFKTAEMDIGTATAEYASHNIYFGIRFAL